MGGRQRWLVIVAAVFAAWCLGVVVLVLVAGGGGDDSPAEAATATTAAPLEGPGLEAAEAGVVQVRTTGEVMSYQSATGRRADGFGSGFVVGDGLVMTAAHVVFGAETVEIAVPGEGREPETHPAEVLGLSECSDVALLRVGGDDGDVPDLPVLRFVEEEPEVGADVTLAGFPEGESEFTLTQGIVSRAEAAEGFLTTATFEYDAVSRPGNSGGPVLTDDGLVAGIAYAEDQDGLGLAVRGDAVAELVDELEAGETPGGLGVHLEAVPLRGRQLAGLFVTAVADGSPAAEMGIQVGDLITGWEEVDGPTPIAGHCRAVAEEEDGNDARLTLVRPSGAEVMQGELGEEDALHVTATVFGTREPSGGFDSSAPDTYRRIGPVRDEAGLFEVPLPRSWRTDALPGFVDATTGRRTASPSRIVVTAIPLTSLEGAFRQAWDGFGDAARGHCQNTHRAFSEGRYEGQEGIFNCGAASAVVATVRDGSRPVGLLIVGSLYGERDITLMARILDDLELLR
jgi:serine protease Do